MNHDVEWLHRSAVDRPPKQHRNRRVNGGVVAVVGGVACLTLDGPIGGALGATVGGAVGFLGRCKSSRGGELWR